METEVSAKVDLGSLGSFDFTPDWAKKDAGVTVGKTRPERPSRGFGEKSEGGERRTDSPRGENKPFTKRPFDRKPKFAKPGLGGGRGPAGAMWEKPKPLDAEVKVLPETKALGTIIRKLQQDYHAYKLKELAYFFLDNPSSVLLRVTPKTAEKLHQCKACGFASTSEADVLAHILNAHLGDYYEAKEIECEPPKGNFNCVAKCGLSGVLLGPPNVHEFNSTVREMIRTRYPEMSEEQYRAHIEMVRDAEVIEEWRKGATKKTVFVAKGAGDESPNLTREQAEGEFKRTMLPSLLDAPKHLMITADMAMKTPSKPLLWAAKDALEAERRAPYGMCFALRGAFHHRKLHFFRANDARGPEFVTGVELKDFDTAHAIPELVKVANFIAEHPCAPKADAAPDPESEKQLVWLASTGHIVAFTNGVFSAVEKFPKYGPQWQKWKSAKPAATEPPEAKAEAAEPAAETAAPAPDGEASPEEPVCEEGKKAEEPPVAVEGTAAEGIEEKKEEIKKDEASTQLAE